MRTSLNIPQEVLDEFDETWENEGLEPRSRAVREAIQEYIERHTSLEGIEGPAVAALAFDYEHTLVIGELHTVQHEFESIIRTTHPANGVSKRSSARDRRCGFENSSISFAISTPLDEST